MPDEPTRKPPVPRRWRPRSLLDQLLVGVACASLATVATVVYDRATAPDWSKTIRYLTQAGEQEQANAVNHNVPTVVPPVASISAGKATPPPVSVSPTSPHVSVPIPSPSLSPAQQQHIVSLVLAQVKVPKPTTADLSRAVVSVLRSHPSLTLSQVVDAVNAYGAKHPPAPGSPGASGLPGSPGPSGLPGIGISVISATEDTDSSPWTVTFHFTLTDGSTTDVGPLNLPSGKNGKDAPSIVSEHITNNGDGTCKNTLTMSDGSTVDSNVWNCSPSPTPTVTPTSPSPS